jgi:hypothetical protein
MVFHIYFLLPTSCSNLQNQIYKHHIKVCQILQALFYDYTHTLFRLLSPFTLLGPHVRWAPCHHGMVSPQDMDGEDSLQLL